MRFLAVLPGVALAATIAGLAFGLTRWIGFPGTSPLIVAILLGMALRLCNGVPAAARPGLAMVVQHALRIGIALLGFRLTLGELSAIGGRGVAVALLTLGGTYAFTCWIGRLLSVDRKLVQLIAAGTSICGASAIIGANTLTQANEEDVSYAVGAVTVMGLLLMLLYPLTARWVPLTSQNYGLWVGSSIHEVPQAVAAGFQRGAVAGEVATVAKLTRVLVLAPAILLGWHLRRREQPGQSGSLRIPVPWFALGFIVAAASSSLNWIPNGGRAVMVDGASVLLCLGMAAVGLETNARGFLDRGLRPLGLTVAATIFIALFSLGLIGLGHG